MLCRRPRGASGTGVHQHEGRQRSAQGGTAMSVKGTSEPTMRRRGSAGRAVAVLAVAALLTGCGATDAGEPDVDTAGLVEANTSFALSLYGRVAEQSDAAANVFMSPLSVSTALAMTYAGARGTTAEEMAGVLGFPEGSPPVILAGLGELDRRLSAQAETSGYLLSQANSLWGQEDYTFLPEFLSLVSEDFGAGFNTVDFVRDT
ncbi:MAG: hypothetical protein GF405_01165, partial [Candidatus Eisenbacteria bacterium]|nr:hypothetical protein [Candidatus Eisenbacteria bacterium]